MIGPQILPFCVGIHPTLAGQGLFDGFNKVRRLSTLLDLTRTNSTKPNQTRPNPNKNIKKSLLTICVGLYLALAGQGPFNGFNEVRRLSSLLMDL